MGLIMKSKIKYFAHQDKKRAHSTGKRLGALLRKYLRDPDENFSVRSEAAALAVKASYYLRRAEVAGRVILTDHGERRQVFINSDAKAVDTK
jgi:hypothetical protein